MSKEPENFRHLRDIPEDELKKAVQKMCKELNIWSSEPTGNVWEAIVNEQIRSRKTTFTEEDPPEKNK